VQESGKVGGCVMEINIRVDMRAVTSSHRRAHKQVIFATVKSLTKIAQRSQEDVTRNVVGHLDTTNQWWKKNRPTGIKVQGANKKNMEARVYTGAKNTWLHRHEYGTSRKAKKKSLIIPGYKKAGTNPNKADPKFTGIKPATWKKARGMTQAFSKWGQRGFLVKKPDSTKKKSSGAWVKGGIAKRKYPQVSMGKKKNTRGMVFIKRKASDEKPELLFITGKRTTRKMRKRIRFRSTVKNTVRKEFRDVFHRELISAFATARR
jgi:hypothetical protein